MDLYNVKQQFLLEAYNRITQVSLPDPASRDYIPTLIYKARSYIALNDPESALSIIPADSESVAVRAVSVLARYVAASDAATETKESTLEEMRDLCVEIEGEDAEGNEWEVGMVRVLAGTAFVRAGEVEEALETLGASTGTEHLEAVAIIVQIYLSIHRTDLAKKEFERAKHFAEDDLLLQLIESSIGLVTGKDGYVNSTSFYTEQLGNPSLSSPHLLTARGVTRLLRGEVTEARSDLEEAMEMGKRKGKGDEETLAALVVAAGLSRGKEKEADVLWSRLASDHPDHPLVVDVQKQTEAFDAFAAKFTVPPLATPVPA